jgi:hypothetical protein
MEATRSSEMSVLTSPTRRHIQKTAFFIATAVKTSNPISVNLIQAAGSYIHVGEVYHNAVTAKLKNRSKKRICCGDIRKYILNDSASRYLLLQWPVCCFKVIVPSHAASNCHVMYAQTQGPLNADSLD